MVNREVLIMRLSIQSIVFLLLLSLFVQQACGLEVTASGSSGTVSKRIDAGDQTYYKSITRLGDGFTVDDWTISGSDKKSINSKVGLGHNSQEISLENSGSASIEGHSMAIPEAVATTMNGQIDGNDGEISVVAQSEKNDMSILAGFAGESSDDGIDIDLDMISSGSAVISGDATINGENCFSDGISQYVDGYDAFVSISGLYSMQDGKFGEFKARTTNSKRAPGSSEYKLIGFKASSDGIKINYDGTAAPSSVSSGAGAAISAAASTWDVATSAKFFSTNGPNALPAAFSWSNSLSKSTIASTYLSARYDRTTKGYILDKTYCMLNKKLLWEIDGIDDTIDGTISSSERDNVFDVQTIALHEQGHMLGLDDIYSASKSYLTMYGYTDGHSDWTLATGDIQGLKALYGI